MIYTKELIRHGGEGRGVELSCFSWSVIGNRNFNHQHITSSHAPIVTTNSQSLIRVPSPDEVRPNLCVAPSLSKNDLIKVLSFCLCGLRLPSLSPVSAERSSSLQPTSAQIS